MLTTCLLHCGRCLLRGVPRLAFAAVAPAATRLGAVTRGESTLNMAVKKPAKKVRELLASAVCCGCCNVLVSLFASCRSIFVALSPCVRCETTKVRSWLIGCARPMSGREIHLQVI